MSRGTQALVLVLVAGLLAAGLSTGCGAPRGRAGGDAGATAGLGRTDADLERGFRLYRDHCSACHGVDGAGDGDLAFLLAPLPRNFRRGEFRLVSTDNGVPTDRDLLRTLRQGMPGSAMPAWGWLGEADLRSLAAVVRHYAVDGRADEILSRQDEGGMSVPEARRLAARQFVPGDPVAPQALARVDAALLERGEEIYAQDCATCHGRDGTGRGSGPLFNTDGILNRPRDFTSGALRGGAERQDFLERILAGMPGTPMAAVQYRDEDDAQAVAAWLETLVDRESWGRMLQTRRTLEAKRSDGRLPRTLEDPAWDALTPRWVPTMTLWWRDERIDGVQVRALHDGERLALRIDWADASADDRPIGGSAFPDALAVMFAEAEVPPFFGMGSTRHPVGIWHWRAAWMWDVAGALDFLDREPLPHRGGVFGEARSDATPYRISGRLEGEPEGRSLTLISTGAGQLVSAEESPSRETVAASWKRETWSLLLVRPLAAGLPNDIELAPGSPLHIALAVWDGSQGDTASQKAVSVWHRFELE